MKFCPKREFSYTGINNIITTTDFVTESDILNFHGEKFLNQWKTFAESKKIIKNKFGTDSGYYYYDYKEICYSTQIYLDS